MHICTKENKGYVYFGDPEEYSFYKDLHEDSLSGLHGGLIGKETKLEIFALIDWFDSRYRTAFWDVEEVGEITEEELWLIEEDLLGKD